MKIITTLEHTRFAENGQVTITFPINDDVLTDELQNIGYSKDCITTDCLVAKIDGDAPSLKCLEDYEVNIDELNYLAKRLDSFDKNDMATFNAAVHSEKIASMKDLINLTYNLHNYTVAADFSDLKRLGTMHTLSMNGGGMAQSELDKVDVEAVGRELLESGKGTVTPYGVLFNNGLEIYQEYNGRNLPAYIYSPEFVMEVMLTKHDDTPDNGNIEHLCLPCPIETINKAIHRLGAADSKDVDVQYLGENYLHDKFLELINYNENIIQLNEMCLAIQNNTEQYSEKLVAVMEYSSAKTASEITGIALSLDKFDFLSGVTESDGGLTSLGFVHCNDSLQEILEYESEFDEPTTQKGAEMTTLKLYSPVFPKLYERDDYGSLEDYSSELSGRDAAEHYDSIDLFVRRENDDLPERGLMEYFHGKTDVDKKVYSAVPSVEVIADTLYGVMICQVSEDLTDAELDDLKDYISGQYSDGYVL